MTTNKLWNTKITLQIITRKINYFQCKGTKEQQNGMLWTEQNTILNFQGSCHMWDSIRMLDQKSWCHFQINIL